MERSNEVNRLFKTYGKEIVGAVEYTLIKRKYKRNTFEWDDAYQIIMVYMCEHLADWDPTRGGISTYAQLLAKSAISAGWVADKAKMRQSNVGTRTIEHLKETDLVNCDFEEDMVTRMWFDDCIDCIREELNEKAVQVLQMHLEGLTQTEIGQQFNPVLTRRQVGMILEDCRKIIEKNPKLRNIF
jgi:RNA polymerase sigma factor (sigma-70 family)